jgi:hypothetical protein
MTGSSVAQGSVALTSILNGVDGDLLTFTNTGATGARYDLGSLKEIGSIKFYAYSTVVVPNVIISISADNVNWIDVLNLENYYAQRASDYGQRIGDLVVITRPQIDCAAGTKSTSSDINIAQMSVCDACIAGTFSGAGAASCTQCVANSYNTGTGNTACIACGDGMKNDKAGQTACSLKCLYNKPEVTSWATPTWKENNTVGSVCTVAGCAGGYWSDPSINGVMGSCTPVEAGYWSPNDVRERNECGVGLTTTGSGIGSDEAGDCSRILHFGDDTLYLRSDKKTTPSLNFDINGTTFYGNMDETDRGAGSLKINYNSKDYTVFSEGI